MGRDMFFKAPPRSILIICARRIGDALLTTPLIATLKKNWPGVAIDVLVFDECASILRHNPDLRQIISIPAQQSFLKKIQFLWELWNRYDLAISTQTGDRPTLYAFIMGRKCIGPIAPKVEGARWKRLLLNETVDFDRTETHTVTQNLKLATKLGLTPVYEVKLAWAKEDEISLAKKCQFDLQKPFVVIHPVPRFKYKMWPQPGWIQLIQWLLKEKIQVVVTAGNCPLEQGYVGQICHHFPDQVVNLAGKLSLSELGFLLFNATAYVGVDTLTTHMAAASDIPTIAIFGPTPPTVWGPWPKGCTTKKPFKNKGSQRYNNVTILQNDQPACVPCYQEGCDKHQNSESLCLNSFPADKVIAALETAIGR